MTDARDTARAQQIVRDWLYDREQLEAAIQRALAEVRAETLQDAADALNKWWRDPLTRCSLLLAQPAPERREP